MRAWFFISYSLGDAINWKLNCFLANRLEVFVPYSLGDAIDWKPDLPLGNILRLSVSYSLGDAIDWKLIDSRTLVLPFP